MIRALQNVMQVHIDTSFGHKVNFTLYYLPIFQYCMFIFPIYLFLICIIFLNVLNFNKYLLFAKLLKFLKNILKTNKNGILIFF